jgi:hypothetical protein
MKMADDADIAQHHAETLHARMIEASKHPTISSTGRCHYCGEHVSGVRLFCDNASDEDRGCHGDWEDEQEIKARQDPKRGWWGDTGRRS